METIRRFRGRTCSLLNPSIVLIALSTFSIQWLYGLQTKPDESATIQPVLGPRDQIVIWASESEEISGKTFTVGDDHFISFPLIGRLEVSGLTLLQLEEKIARELRTYIREPQVTANLVNARSQPVSFIGAVNNPGVHQLTGRNTLLEVLTALGGLRPEAGPSIRVTRPLESGRIPLPDARDDPNQQFSIVDIEVSALLNSEDSSRNITLKANDMVLVPVAEMVYILGEVNRPGSFGLSTRGTLSVLQALSLAGGMTRSAAPKKAKLLRQVANEPKRAELNINLREILAGRSVDVSLMPNDILVVPDSSSKKLATRAIEAAVQTGTGLLTWGIIYR